MHIPTVTPEDLRSFGVNHFSPAHLPTELFYEQDQGDDLGYYADGVKRTITDEQVAIFRNSEVQQIWKDKRKNYEKNKKRNALRTLQRHQAVDQMTTAFLASNASAATAHTSITANPNVMATVEVPTSSGIPVEHDITPVQPISESEESSRGISSSGVGTPGSLNLDAASTSHQFSEHKGLPRAKKKKVARQRRNVYKERRREKKEEEKSAAKAAYDEFTPRRIARELDDKPMEEVNLEY